jgi:hypothetical protein
MVPHDMTADLPLLEMLDAAPERMLAAELVGAVGAILQARGLLKSASGAGDESGAEFVWGFHRAARYGGARRVRNAFALTSAGQRLLYEHGMQASEAARREVAALLRRPHTELFAEVRQASAVA